ncbi:MAG TPA: hypothetical protein VF452_16985, partial [Candidatus Binatia bacterium]
KSDFKQACPGFGAGTYNAFLDKHMVANPGGNSELFARTSPGFFNPNSSVESFKATDWRRKAG